MREWAQPPNGETTWRRPVLVATIGPASASIVVDLLEAGADIFRLNTSHMVFDAVVEQFERTRAADPEVPIVLDLQGAKLRLGWFEPREIRRGERTRFELSVTSQGGIPLPHPELFAGVAPGDTITADDGRFHFAVRETGSDWCLTDALVGGVLGPRKGVNVSEHPVALEDLTPADGRICDWASRLGQVGLACSFMTDGRESVWIRRRAPRARVVGKVERREAVDHIHSLEASVDEVWVCRGDLGAQLGAVELARWVAVHRPPPSGPPVFMAGQVLEHLTQHLEPTRSEVCHLHDIVSRGYAGIVLSDETAIGRQPALAVRTAAGLLAALGAQR